jgi:hypothetical protein
MQDMKQPKCLNEQFTRLNIPDKSEDAIPDMVIRNIVITKNVFGSIGVEIMMMHIRKIEISIQKPNTNR